MRIATHMGIAIKATKISWKKKWFQNKNKRTTSLKSIDYPFNVTRINNKIEVGIKIYTLRSFANR